MAMKSGDVTLEFNDAVFHDILNGMEITALCDRKAYQISRLAGENFHAKQWHSNMKGGRAASLVVPSNYQGMISEATEKTLTKATYAVIGSN